PHDAHQEQPADEAGEGHHEAQAGAHVRAQDQVDRPAEDEHGDDDREQPSEARVPGDGGEDVAHCARLRSYSTIFWTSSSVSMPPVSAVPWSWGVTPTSPLAPGSSFSSGVMQNPGMRPVPWPFEPYRWPW